MLNTNSRGTGKLEKELVHGSAMNEVGVIKTSDGSEDYSEELGYHRATARLPPSASSSMKPEPTASFIGS